MTIAETIERLERMSKAVEYALIQEDPFIRSMYVDNYDMIALHSAAEILDDVRHIRKLMGRAEKEGS